MFGLYQVHGQSMQPALKPGQLVLGCKSQQLNVGNLVVVRHNGLDKIKRVQSVVDGKVFLVGDNVSGSTDSRHFGWIPLENVQAKVIWPRAHNHTSA